MSSVILKLDKDAIDTLFPEGSPQRVELQQAALKRVSETLAKEVVTNEFVKEIRKEIDLYKSRGDINNLLDPILSSHLSEVVRRTINSSLENRLRTLLEDALPKDLKVPPRFDAAYSLSVPEYVHRFLESRILSIENTIVTNLRSYITMKIDSFKIDMVNDLVKQRPQELVNKIPDSNSK